MICKSCQSAGNENANGNDAIARLLHRACKGGTQCDCQHVVGRTARAGKEPK